VSKFHSKVKVYYDEIAEIFLNAVEGKICSPCHKRYSDKDSSLLGYDALSQGEWLLMF
jgi:hypothetical protein